MTAPAPVRPMTPEEFEAWTVAEVESYARELVEASGIELGEARRRSAEETAALLPQGLETEGAQLLRVLDASGRPVGMLWLGAHPRRPGAGWVYDLVIDEAQRGSGHGRAAMLAAEERARVQGWNALSLNVFGRNTVARRLYESLDFEIDSIAMTKELG